MNSKISLASIALLTISFMAATAQAPITVTTDKTAYSDGDTMTISGTVADQLNIPVSIVIRDSAQTPVYIAQASPGASNTYSATVVAGGSLWKNVGTYEIDVTYGGSDKTAKTTFTFTPASQTPTSSVTPQTNSTIPAVPEFGPLAASIFAIAILSVIIMYAKARPLLKI
ncbi:MAG TPA: hypothetical protein VJ571_02055, partial [Candidatus Nitrosotalea sp.]|nr:hypothetical protein [Candidatus Nitrosotalea sp.]